MITACEKVIEVDIPAVDNKDVLNAMFNAEDSILVVELSKSAQILESLPAADSTAIVEVWIGNALAYTLPYNNALSGYGYANQNNNSVYYLKMAAYSKKLPTALANYGKKIEIKARIGSELITASQVMPQMPPDFSATFVSDAVSTGGVENFKYDGFRLRFQDPAGEDYYAVKASMTTYWFNGQDTIIYPSNPISLFGGTDLVFSDYNGQVLLKDNTFDGQEASLLIGGYNIQKPSDNPNEKMGVILERITKEKYLYLTSLARYNNSNGNPFAEPSLVFNNSSSGFGIFGAGSHRVRFLGE